MTDNAEEWAVRILQAAEAQGGFDSEQCLVPFVRQIQAESRRRCSVLPAKLPGTGTIGAHSATNSSKLKDPLKRSKK